MAHAAALSDRASRWSAPPFEGKCSSYVSQLLAASFLSQQIVYPWSLHKRRAVNAVHESIRLPTCAIPIGIASPRAVVRAAVSLRALPPPPRRDVLFLLLALPFPYDQARSLIVVVRVGHRQAALGYHSLIHDRVASMLNAAGGSGGA